MTVETLKMPQIAFGSHKISRLIVGSNPQGGVSHTYRSNVMGKQMIEYFTPERMLEFMRSCIAEGINTWQANYGEKVRDVIFKLREEGKDINMIPLAAPRVPDLGNERIRGMLERIDAGWDRMMAEYKPVGVYLWGALTDILWREGRIDKSLDILKKIRQTGVQVGLCTHIPEVIEYAEEKGWDVDFYMASLYKLSKTREEILAVMSEVPLDGSGGAELYLPSELPRMCDVIRKTKKTCLAFKILAAGRTCNTPEEVSDVFKYVFGHIKPKDAVVVGMYPRYSNEVKENADLVKKFG